jgi:hypothetical protein
LKWSIENNSKDVLPVKSSKADRQLVSAEQRIRELEVQCDILKKKQYGSQSSETVDSGYSEPEFNRLKLQVAKLQAECANARDDAVPLFKPST